MTLQQYKDCLNMVGQASWQLYRARQIADTPQLCGAVDKAFDLALLAVDALVCEVARQAEHHYGDDAREALGDPGACQGQQASMLRHDGPFPYWPIA
jgi:hypothetical protein